LISADRLRLDVSSLTGKSRPIPQTVESIAAAPDAGAVTLSKLAFAGTTVASARGEAVVFATGANTEFGRIARLTQAQDKRPSPLQQTDLTHRRARSGIRGGWGEWRIQFSIGIMVSSPAS
jgi:sodium/potassium-transporting ATPase subunit alpha